MKIEEFDSILKYSREIVEETLAGNLKLKSGGIEDSMIMRALQERAFALRASEQEEIEEEYTGQDKIDLSLINVDPSAQEIVKRVKAIKSKPQANQPKVITCLFHGAPGTGKTTLAKEMVKSLGMKPLVKSYADIQSKYVGDGEKQLAKFFAEARKDKKVLILDECDALMINRENASREYQKTMTNQFLTELDKHTGLFIATTNFVNTLDAACLRRLFLKLQFDWMDEEQKVKAFKHFFGKRVKSVPVDHLTAGDFKAVRERALYEPDEKVSTERYIELLQDEVDYKKQSMAEVKNAETSSVLDLLGG